MDIWQIYGLTVSVYLFVDRSLTCLIGRNGIVFFPPCGLAYCDWKRLALVVCEQEASSHRLD